MFPCGLLKTFKFRSRIQVDSLVRAMHNDNLRLQLFSSLSKLTSGCKWYHHRSQENQLRPKFNRIMYLRWWSLFAIALTTTIARGRRTHMLIIFRPSYIHAVGNEPLQWTRPLSLFLGLCHTKAIWKGLEKYSSSSPDFLDAVIVSPTGLHFDLHILIIFPPSCEFVALNQLW